MTKIDKNKHLRDWNQKQCLKVPMADCLKCSEDHKPKKKSDCGGRYSLGELT